MQRSNALIMFSLPGHLRALTSTCIDTAQAHHVLVLENGSMVMYFLSILVNIFILHATFNLF